jgi:hypothetical protein
MHLGRSEVVMSKLVLTAVTAPTVIVSLSRIDRQANPQTELGFPTFQEYSQVKA